MMLGKVKYGEIEAVVDYGLFEPAPYIEETGEYYIVFLSFYGSHSAVNAIFAALASFSTLLLITPQTDQNTSFHISRSYSLSGKTTRIGYGKYNIIAYSNLHDYIIQYPGEDEITAWTRYLEKRKALPFKKGWIPALKEVLAEGELKECRGIGGFKGWKITLNDDQICDLIVKHIYK